MDCVELRKKDLKIDNIKSGMQADKGVFYLKPFTMDIFGAKGEGDVVADKTEEDATHHYRVALRGRLNLVDERYDDVIVSLSMTRDVCNKTKHQRPRNPESRRCQSSVPCRPILHLYGKAETFFQGGKCESL